MKVLVIGGTGFSGPHVVRRLHALGHELVLFTAPASTVQRERLSIIVPVYNEERYVGEVLRALIDKELPIEREILVVESNSDDNSRAIVRSFEGEPSVRVLSQAGG